MIEIALSALALGLWRAWDGSGTYVKESTMRVAIAFALAGAIIAVCGGHAFVGSLLAAAAGVALVAGTVWSLQRGFDDWSDPIDAMLHFLLPSACAVVPWAVWQSMGDGFLKAGFAIVFIAGCTLSGLTYAYEGRLFGKLPRPTLGKIKLDPHRYAEFINGAAHGAMLAMIARVT